MINQRNQGKSRSIKKFDANEISLDPPKVNEKHGYVEPYTEINRDNDSLEIILEVPGTTIDDIVISFINQGTLLEFSAENQNRRYIKKIELPFKSSLESTDFEINNGLAILKINEE
jgi:HSP20 family molecular chaperone IbpA